jgi:hypothetical protein
MTAQLLVMDLQILLGTATLTSPTISLHHLSAQLPIRLGS